MHSEAIDTRSDVYALGAILYELVTGTLPFMLGAAQDVPFDEVLRRIREDDPPKPSLRAQSMPSRGGERIPPDLDWIVLKALRKDPTERYSSVPEFAVDVERFLNDEAVTARPPSALYTTRKLIGRHKTLAATIVAGSLALLVGTIVSTLLFLRAEENALRAEQSEQSEKETFSRSDFFGSEHLLRNGQSADAVAQLVRAIRTNPANRAARFKLLSTLVYTEFLQPTHPPIEGDPKPTGVAISSDEAWVAIGSELGSAQVWNLETGEPLTTIMHRGKVTTVSFHPTEPNLLATASDDHTAALWDISTGEQIREFRQGMGNVGSIHSRR